MVKHAHVFAAILLGCAAPVYAASNKADVCQKVGTVLGPHLEANKDVAMALTVMKISGTTDERERAKEVFDMVSENQTRLIEGLDEIVELCSDN